MIQNHTKRKLTSILSADVVGYSRILRENDASTIQNLEENKKLIFKLIEEFEGCNIVAPGDNILAEFSNVINAVKCALKIQQELDKKNSESSENHRIDFRIGINLGDAGRMYGSGVNIAARIKSVAEHGGIYISNRAYDHVKGKLELGYEYLGEHYVLGIPEPVGVYRVLTDPDSIGKVIGDKKFSSKSFFRMAMVAILILLIATVVTILWNSGSQQPQKNESTPLVGIRVPVPGPRTLWWVDRNGKETKIDVPPGPYYFPKISPDGTKVLLTIGNVLRSIHIFDLVQGKTQQITTASRHNQCIWSPDGKQVAYALWNRTPDGGLSTIFLDTAEGNGEPVKLVSPPGKLNIPYCFNKDGSLLVTTEAGPQFKNFDIGMITLGEKSGYTLLMDKSYHEFQPQLSPDGKWLAYCTAESGNLQVYVSPFPDVKKRKWQVSIEEGNSPRWSPDGKELYYLMGMQKIEFVMVVKVETEPTFSPGKAEILFRSEGLYLGSWPANGIPYDVHPDGQHFLMMKEIKE